MNTRPFLLASLLVIALTACSSEPEIDAVAFDQSADTPAAQQPTSTTSLPATATPLPSNVVELGSFELPRRAGNFLWVQPSGETYFGFADGWPAEYSVATGEPLTVFDDFDFYEASSADGERVMFMRRPNDQTREWGIFNRSTGQTTLVPWTATTPEGEVSFSTSISPTGNLMAIPNYATEDAGTLRLELVDTTTGEHSTLAEPLPTNYSLESASWAPDDSLLAIPADGDLALIDVPTRTHQMLPGGELGEVTATAVSPDGSQLAFIASREASVQSNSDDDAESPEPRQEHALFVVDLEGLTTLANAQQLIDYELPTIRPIWAADGDQILIHAPFAGVNATVLRLIDPASGTVTAIEPRLPSDAEFEGIISFSGPPPLIRQGDGAIMFWMQEALPETRTWHLQAWTPSE